MLDVTELLIYLEERREEKGQLLAEAYSAKIDSIAIRRARDRYAAHIEMIDMVIDHIQDQIADPADGFED
jgi:hypothetical protein